MSFLFLTTSEKTLDTKSNHSLTSDKDFGTIVAKLATRNQADLELLTQLSCGKTQGVLIEFPGVLLATFVPILETLQRMQRLGVLPFRQWIVPDSSSARVDVPPPVYARNPAFFFSLQSVSTSRSSSLSLSPNESIDDETVLNKLENQTTLDRGQCQALMAALTREFAFIQGPPGTGKSYVGVQLVKVLLASKGKVKLGPIVVV